MRGVVFEYLRGYESWGDNFSPRMPCQWYVRGGGEGKRRILIGPFPSPLLEWHSDVLSCHLRFDCFIPKIRGPGSTVRRKPQTVENLVKLFRFKFRMPSKLLLTIELFFIIGWIVWRKKHDPHYFGSALIVYGSSILDNCGSGFW
jgi:hypothetical protein